MEERENNVAMMRLVIDLASDLAVGIVKVFAAWPGVVNDEGETAFYAPYERGNYYKFDRANTRALAYIKSLVMAPQIA